MPQKDNTFNYAELTCSIYAITGLYDIEYYFNLMFSLKLFHMGNFSK